MNIENTVQLDNNLSSTLNLEKKQNSFLNNLLGNAINTGLDVGIRAIFPNFIEDEIIGIKDSLLSNGLTDGISKAIDGAINLGKNAIGVISKGFENTLQIQSAIASGGLIDGVSKAFDVALSNTEEKGEIKSNVSNLIKEKKNSIISNVENNVDKSINEQIESSNNLDKYIENWKEYFNEQDFTNMEKQYKKIKKELKNLVPIEKSINNARTIENIHKLVKSKGKNFDLSETEQELIKKLS